MVVLSFLESVVRVAPSPALFKLLNNMAVLLCQFSQVLVVLLRIVRVNPGGEPLAILRCIKLFVQLYEALAVLRRVLLSQPGQQLLEIDAQDLPVAPRPVPRHSRNGDHPIDQFPVQFVGMGREQALDLFKSLEHRLQSCASLAPGISGKSAAALLSGRSPRRTDGKAGEGELRCSD
jgi:hypothetical protein